MEIHRYKGKPLPKERLHYKVIPMTTPGWDTLQEMSKKVNMMSYEALSGLKSGIAKTNDQQWFEVLSTLSDFTNQDGKNLGAVDKLSSDYLVVIDSLSGLNHMVRALHVGMKPSMHQGEWGVIMHTLEMFVNAFVSGTKCFTCLTGHIEKEMDEVIGKPQYMPGFLGRKLSPKMPRIFSDVVLAARDEDKFKWSTTRSNYSSLKARNLTLSDSLQPDFTQIVKAWKKRNS